ncbi:MAG: NAD(P)/FAD-dependent oxidoreductase [Thermoleophilia bacterium]|nr:NAD(P)/FAD-dependent oxidoreductase [Thermoleophilia bacterium]
MSTLDEPFAPTATIAVIGAGLAGSRCATALRRHGHQGRVLLIGDEPVGAYERPALSKQYLAGTRDAAELSVAGTSTDALAAAGVDVRLGAAATRLADGVIELDDGELVEVGATVLATGAAPRQLPCAPLGARVHELRNLADATRLKASLAPGQHLVIIGSGFVGSEVASTVRAAGVRVTLLEAAPIPLATRIGHVAGHWLARRWRSAGIELRCGVSVERVEPHPDGSCVQIDLAGAEPLIADHVLVAVGTAASDALFHAAWPGHGTVGAGIPVDAHGRTPVPGVWAVGDASCRASASGASLRAEHWTDAAVNAERLARVLTGAALLPAPAAYAWSDQFGVRIQVAGRVGGDLPHQIEHDGPETLLVRYLRESGDLAGMLAIGFPADIARCRTQLAS